MFLAYIFLLSFSLALEAMHDLSIFQDFSSQFSLHKIYNDRELEGNSQPIVVSLGANCIPAFQALIHGIRSASYPFDWLISDIESIYINLDKNFLNFLDKDYCSLNGTWIHIAIIN